MESCQPTKRLKDKKEKIDTDIWRRRDFLRITASTDQYCERNIFTQIGRLAKYWLDIHHSGAGLAVTERIREVGQKFHNLFFLPKQEEAVTRFTSTFCSLSHSSRRPLL